MPCALFSCVAWKQKLVDEHKSVYTGRGIYWGVYWWTEEHKESFILGQDCGDSSQLASTFVRSALSTITGAFRESMDFRSISHLWICKKVETIALVTIWTEKERIFENNHEGDFHKSSALKICCSACVKLFSKHPFRFFFFESDGCRLGCFLPEVTFCTCSIWDGSVSDQSNYSNLRKKFQEVSYTTELSMSVTNSVCFDKGPNTGISGSVSIVVHSGKGVHTYLWFQQH